MRVDKIAKRRIRQIIVHGELYRIDDFVGFRAKERGTYNRAGFIVDERFEHAFAFFQNFRFRNCRRIHFDDTAIELFCVRFFFSEPGFGIRRVDKN